MMKLNFIDLLIFKLNYCSLLDMELTSLTVEAMFAAVVSLYNYLCMYTDCFWYLFAITKEYVEFRELCLHINATKTHIITFNILYIFMVNY